MKTMASGLMALALLVGMTGKSDAALLGGFGEHWSGRWPEFVPSVVFEIRYADFFQIRYRNFTEQEAPLFFLEEIDKDAVFILDSGDNFSWVAQNLVDGINSPIAVRMSGYGVRISIAPESYRFFGLFEQTDRIDFAGASIDRVTLTISEFDLERISSGDYLTRFSMSWQVDIYGTPPAAAAAPPTLALLAAAVAGLGLMVTGGRPRRARS